MSTINNIIEMFKTEAPAFLPKSPANKTVNPKDLSVLHTLANKVKKGKRGLLSFPKNTEEMGAYIYELEQKDPIKVNSSSLDYQINWFTREAEVVPYHYVSMSPPKTSNFQNEWIVAGIRMDYFYFNWIKSHTRNQASINMFEMAGVPQACMDIPPTRQPMYLALESMSELESFINNFREGIATITAQYLFVHQVFRNNEWIYPQGSPRPFTHKPLYGLVYSGPVATRVAFEGGIPVYLLKEDFHAYYLARLTFVRMIAHSSNDLLKEELRREGTTEELNEFQREEDAIRMAEECPKDQEIIQDLEKIEKWGSQESSPEEKDEWHSIDISRYDNWMPPRPLTPILSESEDVENALGSRGNPIIVEPLPLKEGVYFKWPPSPSRSLDSGSTTEEIDTDSDHEDMLYDAEEDTWYSKKEFRPPLAHGNEY
jgi:hypothetical protein